jgi:hypothetical protein
MGASGAKSGLATSHFYWIGVVPAMVFVGVFMMPFYYGSKAHSVPEYMRLRFDERTRGLNAISFATMTLFLSGIPTRRTGLLVDGTPERRQCLLVSKTCQPGNWHNWISCNSEFCFSLE